MQIDRKKVTKLTQEKTLIRDFNDMQIFRLAPVISSDAPMHFAFL